jgi:DNA recombination protein RmuC
MTSIIMIMSLFLMAMFIMWRQISAVRMEMGQFIEQGRGITELQNILHAPKLRGNWGEVQLGAMLAQVLSKNQFSMQHSFKNGDICDAMILLQDGLKLSVDSKFSLENFRKIFSTRDSREATGFKKTFYADVKRRIDEISDKYIRPEEGTLSIALMFIPAESVYYYAFVEDKEETGLRQYAFQKKVVPVSPGSLYAYLEIIQFGLRGLEIEKGAQQIQQNLLGLNIDFGQLEESYNKAQKQLHYAQKNLEEGERWVQSVKGKLASLAGSISSSHQSIQEGSYVSNDTRESISLDT